MSMAKKAKQNCLYKVHVGDWLKIFVFGNIFRCGWKKVSNMVQ